MKWSLLVLCLLGCGPQPESPDITLAQFCNEAAIAFCGRIITCGVDAPTCTVDFARGCCPGGICTGSVNVSRVDECVSALATESCADATGGTVPQGCKP